MKNLGGVLYGSTVSSEVMEQAGLPRSRGEGEVAEKGEKGIHRDGDGVPFLGEVRRRPVGEVGEEVSSRCCLRGRGEDEGGHGDPEVGDVADEEDDGLAGTALVTGFASIRPSPTEAVVASAMAGRGNE